MTSGLGFAHRLFYALSVALVFAQVAPVLLMVFGKRGQGHTGVVLGSVLVNRHAMY